VIDPLLKWTGRPLHDEAFGRIVDAAAGRLTDTLTRETPALGARVIPWLESLSRTGKLSDYFLHPRRFPMLLLPWWAADGTRSREDPRFHEDVARSTMAGYCHIRLLDDLMDGRGTPGLDLLPAAGVFHLEFQSAYQRHFVPDSPFWTLFRDRWLRAADGTVAGSAANAVALGDRAEATLGPVLIPIAAACFHAGVPDRFEEWRPVVLELARLEQLIDDVFDWQDDDARGQPNLVLAEAAQRVRKGETTLAWVIREGYAWALDAARARAATAMVSAERLRNEGLSRFVAARAELIGEIAADTAPGLAQLAGLAKAFGER
jgi:hypothetical protein